MGRRPVCTGGEVVRAPERAGFVVVRIKGSHHHLRRQAGGPLVTVPCHRGETLKPKTLSSILEQAGLTLDEFRDLLR